MRGLAKTSLTIVLAISLLLIAGCQSISVNRYADLQPSFSLYDYFNGSTRGWGMVFDRSGALTRQFTVDIIGTVNDSGQLVLDEDFIWNDGEQEKRVWTISRSQDGVYRGVAGDVIGTASGQSSGNALHWQYTLALEVDGKEWEIHFEDWMFLQPDGVLLNRAIMSKFGLRVGEVFIAFQKR